MKKKLQIVINDESILEGTDYKNLITKIEEINQPILYGDGINIEILVEKPWGSYIYNPEKFFIPPSNRPVVKEFYANSPSDLGFVANPTTGGHVHIEVEKDPVIDYPGSGGVTFNIVLDEKFENNDVIPPPFKLIDEEVLKNFTFVDTDKESELIEIHAMIPEGSLIVPPHLIKEWAKRVIIKSYRSSTNTSSVVADNLEDLIVQQKEKGSDFYTTKFLLKCIFDILLEYHVKNKDK